MTVDPIWIKILVYLIGGVGSIFVAFFAWLLRSTAKLKTDVEVVKTVLSRALQLSENVKENKESIIRLDERQNKVKEDLNALHRAKRDILDKIS